MGGGKDWKNKVTRPITPQVLKGYKDRLPVDESIKWNQNQFKDKNRERSKDTKNNGYKTQRSVDKKRKDLVLFGKVNLNEDLRVESSNHE